MKKVGRNDPCPCGSGKKFKKCCENKMMKGKFMAQKIDQKVVDQVPKMGNLGSLFAQNVPPPNPPTKSADIHKEKSEKKPENTAKKKSQDTSK